jgi:hypothetical protein
MAACARGSPAGDRVGAEIMIVNLTRERRTLHLTDEGAPLDAGPTILLAQRQRRRALKRHVPWEV